MSAEVCPRETVRVIPSPSRPMPAPSADARDLWLLSTAQALFMSISILTVAVASVAAGALAADPRLATLPQATIPLVAMATVLPAASLMRRIGRRAGFLLGAGAGLASGALSALALWLGSYAAFVASVALLGVYQGFATYYRFAVADRAPEHLRARSVSFVLAGGVVAAVLGPSLGSAARDLVPGTPFLGSYLATVGLNLAAVAVLAGLRPDAAPAPAPTSAGVRPSPRALLARPRYALAAACCSIGQGTMVLVMTATPLAMLGHGHSLGFAGLVISAHVLAMFVPSFFSGPLIGRLGVRPVLIAGLASMAVSAIVAMLGTTGAHFALALVVNGLAWNFLFVGGSTLLAGIADLDERALVQGANEFLTFALTALAALASGAVYASLGWGALNVASLGAIALLGALMAGLGGRVFGAGAARPAARS